MFNGELIWGVSWVWYLIGLLGIGGTIAFFVLAPAVAAPIFQAVFRFLFSTRPGWAIMAALILVPLADAHRSRKDEAAFARRTAEFEQKQKERDERIRAETRDEVTKELADQATSNTKVDTDVDAFKQSLPPVPATGNPFAVGPDACRLRVIAGLACNKDRSSATRLPAPRPRPKAPQHRGGK